VLYPPPTIDFFAADFAVEYSHDMQEWKRAGDVVIVGGANRVQWIDAGAPKTSKHPDEVATRYYRVVKLEEAASGEK